MLVVKDRLIPLRITIFHFFKFNIPPFGNVVLSFVFVLQLSAASLFFQPFTGSFKFQNLKKPLITCFSSASPFLPPKRPLPLPLVISFLNFKFQISTRQHFL